MFGWEWKSGGMEKVSLYKFTHIRLLKNDGQLKKKSDKQPCKGTIPLRPNNDVGLAYERSLTIWFVESGLEKLAAGHGAMPGLDFRGIHVEKRSWA